MIALAKPSQEQYKSPTTRTMSSLDHEHTAMPPTPEAEAPDEQLVEATETRLLINSERTAIYGNTIDQPESLFSRRSRGNRIAAFLVVLLAFSGIFFYFFYSPSPKDWKPTKASLPRDATAAVAPTILISLDGFRHEYLSRKKKASTAFLAPTLHTLATKGVHAKGGMQPVVPTITFPNHWALATGLYPESNGIVSNTMYDPVKKSWFHVDRVNPGWWFGEPVWQTLRRTLREVKFSNGTQETLQQNYTTASVFWPGSEVEKHAPDLFFKYDNTVPLHERVDRAVAALQGTNADLNREAQFVTLYFEDVDHEGHEHGPYSDEVAEAIERVDEALAYLLKSLGEDVAERYNIVVVSDHGMTATSEERTIDLKHVLKEGTVQDVMSSPMGLFLNESISAEELYTTLKDGLKNESEHVKVYRKADLPERWHLGASRLITPVVTMAALGWTVRYPHQHIVPDADVSVRTPGKLHGQGDWETEPGSHGFDNTYEDMMAIFVASGPAFKGGATVEGMRSIDVYEMLCNVFGATPAPNNGSLGVTMTSVLKG